MTSLAKRLKQALDGPPRTSQKAMADACKVSPPSVSDWLSGKSKTMTGGSLLAASKLLRVNPTWLAEGIGPMRGGELPWPFPDIEPERFHRLTEKQKIEIQGAVRNMIQEYESAVVNRKVA